MNHSLHLFNLQMKQEKKDLYFSRKDHIEHEKLVHLSTAGLNLFRVLFSS